MNPFSLALRTSVTSALKQTLSKTAVCQNARQLSSDTATKGPWFDLTDEQKSMLDMTEKFAREEIMPRAAEYDKSMEYPQDIFEKSWDLGFANSTVPVKYGGLGMGMIDRCLTGEKLNYACSGIATAIGSNGLAQSPLILFGTEEQKKEFLGRCTSEKIQVAYAVTEPNTGSDVAGITTKAEKNADGDWVLNGQKVSALQLIILSFYLHSFF